MSRLRPFGLILALSVLCTPLTPPSVLAWEFTERGTGNTFDQALAVALRGHVFAAGRINDDGFAVKLQRQHGDAIWRYHPAGNVDGSEVARAVAVDPAGHPIFAGVGTEQDTVNRGRFTVIKIDKDTGVPHWITRVDRGDAFGVAVDAAGDVIAAGVLGDDMGIVKIRGTDGAELWRAQPRDAAPLGQALALALDGAGNAVAVGTLRPGEFEQEFAVVKVSGADGSELWRHQIARHEFSGGDAALGVAVDGSGDVVAVGIVRVFVDNSLPSKFTVIKLAGATGSLRWRHDVPEGTSSGNGTSVVLDAVGDVIAAGIIGVTLGVIKLDAATGSEQWRHTGGPPPSPFSGRVVDVDRAGDVLAASRGIVRKLMGASGVQIWEQAPPALAFSRGIAVDEVGDVVVVGDGNAGFVVVKRKGSDGSEF
jgi:outer membrane protein assembly factor BamB